SPCGLYGGMGRHQVDQGVRLDRADEGQGSSADRFGRQGICRGQRRLAEAHGALRQVVVTSFFTLPTEVRCFRLRSLYTLNSGKPEFSGGGWTERSKAKWGPGGGDIAATHTPLAPLATLPTRGEGAQRQPVNVDLMAAPASKPDKASAAADTILSVNNIEVV